MKLKKNILPALAGFALFASSCSEESKEKVNDAAESAKDDTEEVAVKAEQPIKEVPEVVEEKTEESIEATAQDTVKVGVLHSLSGTMAISETSLRDVMTANPDTLRTGDGVSYAVERMATRGFRNIPIFDDDDPAAVLTVWDVMTHLSTVLAEVQENKTICLDEWTDIGGG